MCGFFNECKVIAKITGAKTKSKTTSRSERCQPVSIKLQEIFISLTVHSQYHHTDYHS